MRLKEIAYIVLFAAAFTAMGFYVYQVKSENNSLRKSIDRIDGQLELHKEKNQKEIDSIQKSINKRTIELAELKNRVPALENRIEIINRRTHENKKIISRITDADSLAMFLTRRYRQ
jgi:predicted  nucleic acid-binding Zn-ribbon protein